jgi:hypothetical protein
MKKNIKFSKFDDFETISSDCSVKRIDDKLTIIITFSSNFKLYKNLLLICILFYVFFLMFLFNGLIFQGLIFLIFLTFIITPCILGSLYYKNQKHEWFFTKSTQDIEFVKNFAHFEKAKKFNFSNVKSLIYQHNTKYWYPRFYDLTMILRNNDKIRIYIGEKEECEELGKIVSEFINITLNYQTKMRIYYN